MSEPMVDILETPAFSELGAKTADLMLAHAWEHIRGRLVILPADGAWSVSDYIAVTLRRSR